MKATLFSLVFVFQSSMALGFSGFSCFNSSSDVVFNLFKKEKEVVIEWHLKRGLRSFPLYDGIMNLDMIPILEMQAQDLKEFDQGLIRFSHQIQNCKFDDKEKQVECFGPTVFSNPQTQKITSTTLMTSWLEEKLKDWSYKAFKVRVGLDANGNHYLAAFVFDPKKCQFFE